MNLKFRWALIILLIGGALYFMLPLQDSVRLGLDLQGGMHVVLSVDTEKAVDGKVDSIVYQLRRELQRENIAFSYAQKAAGHTINIGGIEAADVKKVNEIADKFLLRGRQGSDGVMSFTISNIDETRDNAVKQSLEVVRNRIDEFGVAEPFIQRQGKNQIVVQLPGIEDPDRATNLIGQTAQLRFYLVDNTVTLSNMLNKSMPYGTMLLYGRENTKASTKEINEAVIFDASNVDKIKLFNQNSGKVFDREGNIYTPYALKQEAMLTGDSLMDAGVQYNQYQEPIVWFRFDPAGARVFSDLTAANVGKQLAIVLDDNVYSAPNIREKIGGGEGTISGNFTVETAQDLAIVLRAGSLPAPVSIEENRTVGPSLGRDSIESGVKACIIGLALIIIFMVFYYRLSGLVADLGLVCNFILLLGALCALGATLTLPGIAGVILTLGIAVDANVLIFERVREELRNKRTVMNAFEIGYHKAFSTIVDANVTSLIAAVVLFQFGTGPVKGFAVTLSLGLLASMFTAVFVTRTVFMTFILRKDPDNVSI